MDPWSILRALWLFLPAYVANMSPVFSAKLMPGWKAPIDGGRIASDGRRVLGDGKTWRGLTGGTLAGAATALAMAIVAGAVAPSWLDGWDFGYEGGTGGWPGAQGPCDIDADCEPPASAWWQVAMFGGIVGFFALVGDATESYLKRRRGLERGAPWIPFDQLDFVVFGLIGMAVAAPLLADGWVWAALTSDWLVLATIVAGTVVLHLLVNRIGYWLQLKEVPW